MSKIEIVMFDGTNYHDWESALLFFLKGKDLASTLTETQPNDPTESKSWRKTDQQAFGKNGERVNVVFHEQLRQATTARELLDAVKKISEESSTNVAIRARRAFMNLKYEDGENFDKFISEMERFRCPFFHFI